MINGYVAMMNHDVDAENYGGDEWMMRMMAVEVPYWLWTMHHGDDGALMMLVLMKPILDRSVSMCSMDWVVVVVVHHVVADADDEDDDDVVVVVVVGDDDGY